MSSNSPSPGVIWSSAMLVAVVMLSTGCTVTVSSAGGGGGQPQGAAASDDNQGTDGGTPPADTDTDPGSDAQPELSEGVTTQEYTADQAITTSSIVPAAAGGSVTLPGDAEVRVEIPAGSLATDSMISATLLRGPADDPYALGIVVESDSANLPDSTMVVIPLNPPLEVGVSLRTVDLPSDDPADSADTNQVAEISSDRTEARIPLYPIATLPTTSPRDGPSVSPKKGVSTRINCHFGTMTDVFRGLGKDPATIRSEVEQANPGRLSPADFDALEANLTAIQSGQPCFPNDRQMGAFIGTYYEEDPVSSQIAGDKDSSGNLLPLSLTDTCKTNLSSAASGDLPVVMFQGRSLVKDGQGFYTNIAHTARVTQQNGQTVILNDLSISARQRTRLEAARRAANLDPSAPLTLPFDQLTGDQRNQRTGQLIEQHIRELEGNDDYEFVPVPVESRPQNLGDMVIFTPRSPGGTNQQPIFASCSTDDVTFPEPEPLFQVFLVTNYGSIADGYLTVRNSDAPNDPPLLSTFPGGGISPELRADLTPFTEDQFATPEAAAASICSGFERYWSPTLASFISAADWNGQSFGIDSIFSSQCPLD